MNSSQLPRTTAGIRQFENTAVAKLEAEGVPAHLARAFVHQGIPKYGSQDILRDTVCKMRYERFFIQKTPEDYKDPFRVGALVPTVHESKTQKFFTEFAMSDIESAFFNKMFPEFDVVARGRTYNQHAFYANKRYAEAELLMSMVYRYAHVYGQNPKSVVDLGGNSSWHAKRDRGYIHCDNPVLSARDVMRYVVRDVFSQGSQSTVCSKTFQECTHQADFAIAVHSTYDITPKTLAMSMRHRNIKTFFGVINYIPGLQLKPEGTYEADGLVAKIVRPSLKPHYVDFTFRHDPSLHYTHRLSVLTKYLFVRRSYQVFDEDGDEHWYTYKIESVRGNSMIFSITQGAVPSLSTDAVWTPPSKSMYYLSLQFIGLDKMEVDAEFFDRLVLQAASARNIQEYDILALFRYAKSLRQRVSINGVVLSSGYTHNPEDLVYCTIAAFAIAASYKQESIGYFKEASRQIVSLRGRGFLRDTFDIIGVALLKSLLVLPAAFVYYSGLSTLNDRLKQIIASKGAVVVELYKPHSLQGQKYIKKFTDLKRLTDGAFTLRRPLQLAPKAFELVLASTVQGGHSKPSPPAGFSYRPVVDALKPIFAECAGKMYCFRSKGTVNYDSHELPRPITQFIHYDFSDVDVSSSKDIDVTRSILYRHSARRISGFARADPRFVVMPNGDRLYLYDSEATQMYRTVAREDMPFDVQQRQYMVFRGVGKYAVVLTPPALYSKGVCLRFVLFYDHCLDYEELKQHTKSKGIDELHYELPEMSAAAPSPLLTTDAGWHDLAGGEHVRRFASEEQAQDFVREAASRGEYYMSGALTGTPHTPPLSSVSSHDSEPGSPSLAGPAVVPLSMFGPEADPLGEHVEVDALLEARQALAFREDSAKEGLGITETVQSDEIVPGAAAINELIYVCERSEQIALESSLAVVDMAISAAGGQAPLSKFSAVAKGHPGDIIGVRVNEVDDVWTDIATGNLVEHMAVSDGHRVYDRITRPPPSGVYVTSRVMEVYTGGAVKNSLREVATDRFSCPVICIDGVAGSGKSYQITHSAQPGDVVLCETKASLRDIATDLHELPEWRGHCYTVDAFLMHKPVRECSTLWIDEAFRLHAAKIFAVMKLLKPREIFAFGDRKQIPALPFVPGYEFQYSSFPFLSTDRRTMSHRIPADIAMGLSSLAYYGTHVTTRNPVLHSVSPPEQYVSGMFARKPSGVPLLVYTQVRKDALAKEGVTHVMTIGESQGKTFDDVIVFREEALAKELYFSEFQTLVGATRHRRTLRYVTADTVTTDTSMMAKLIRDINAAGTEIVLASHQVSGVKPAYDAHALAVREAAGEDSDRESRGRVRRTRARSRSTAADAASAQGDIGDIADYVADFEFEGL